MEEHVEQQRVVLRADGQLVEVRIRLYRIVIPQFLQLLLVFFWGEFVLAHRAGGGRREEGARCDGKNEVEHAAVVSQMTVFVGKAVMGEYGLEMRGLLCCDQVLVGREVRHAEHAHVPVTPGLARYPFDNIIAVFLLLDAKVRVRAP